MRAKLPRPAALTAVPLQRRQERPLLPVPHVHRAVLAPAHHERQARRPAAEARADDEAALPVRLPPVAHGRAARTREAVRAKVVQVDLLFERAFGRRIAVFD